jgi:hypothetical protein
MPLPAGIKRRLAERPSNRGECVEWLELAVQHGRLPSMKVIELGKKVLRKRHRIVRNRISDESENVTASIKREFRSFAKKEQRELLKGVRGLFDDRAKLLLKQKKKAERECLDHQSQLIRLWDALIEANNEPAWLWAQVSHPTVGQPDVWCLVALLDPPTEEVSIAVNNARSMHPDPFALMQLKKKIVIQLVTPPNLAQSRRSWRPCPAREEFHAHSYRTGPITWVGYHRWVGPDFAPSVESILLAHAAFRICPEPLAHLTNTPHRCQIPIHIGEVANLALDGIKDLALMVISFLSVSLNPKIVQPFMLPWDQPRKNPI